MSPYCHDIDSMLDNCNALITNTSVEVYYSALICKNFSSAHLVIKIKDYLSFQVNKSKLANPECHQAKRWTTK